jgi:Calx-beta domain
MVRSVCFVVRVWAALLLACLCATSALASDNFPGTTISGTGTLQGNNVGATSETGEPLSLGGGALNTLWYSWTAPTSGTVSFGTCNPTGSSLTDFDTTIGIYTGTAVNALTQVGFNDDVPGCNSVVNPDYGSTLIFTATAGTTYRIQIDGYANTTGNFQLFYGYSGYTQNLTDQAATEAAGNTGAFTLVLNAVPSATATLTMGSSPQCTFSPATLTFTSANWNVAQTVTVTPIDDAIAEGTHFCAPASITPSGGGVVGSAAPPPAVTITDNDNATLTIANTTNGAEAGPVNGVVTVNQAVVANANTVVSYTVTGTATSGVDFTALSGTVTIAQGATSATISIPVINDAIVEANETVIITLSSVTAGVGVIGTPSSATNTISSDDTATVSIVVTTNGNETGPVSAVFTVTQTVVSSTNTVINLTRGGTSTITSDYTSPGTTVTIPAGSTTATLTHPVVNDAIVEGDETLIVTLASISSGLATLGSPASASATILDNDSATVSIANTTNGAEAGPVNGVMTITQSAQSTANTVIAYAVSGTARAGFDYTALSGTVTVTAGATTATITIPMINDTLFDPGETVIVTLTTVSSGINTTLGAPLAATNTITDNDTALPALTLLKSADTAGPVVVGNLITYSYVVHNSGNTVINGVNIADVHNGLGSFTGVSGETLTTDAVPTGDSTDGGINGNWSILAPGDSVTFTATYSVVQGDIDYRQ